MYSLTKPVIKSYFFPFRKYQTMIFTVAKIKIKKAAKMYLLGELSLKNPHFSYTRRQ